MFMGLKSTYDVFQHPGFRSANFLLSRKSFLTVLDASEDENYTYNTRKRLHAGNHEEQVFLEDPGFQ